MSLVTWLMSIRSTVKNMESDDDQPTLSADTLAILQAFLAEEAVNKEAHVSNEDTTNYFKENWQLSQFWYSIDTTKALTKVVKNVVPNGGKVALISCPSLYTCIRKVLNQDCDVTLFEYDTRFNMYGKDFCFYDFNHPLDYPFQYKSSFDVVVADPPYISQECLIKVAQTIKGIKKDKVILCTGQVQEKIAMEHLGLKLVHFKPQHSSNLANEFSCFSNFDLDSVLQEE